MTIRVDPEGNEIHALFDMLDLTGQRVLEIGSGTGRLTRRYAGRAAHVTAIEPFAQSVERAKQNTPQELKDHVEFHPVNLEQFASAAGANTFNIAILSWSL